MSTKLSEIKIVNNLENKINSTVEAITNEFYGITLIHFIEDNINENISVMVYTKNLGTLNISELLEIQKRLNAKSLLISKFPIIAKCNGLIYILQY